MSHLCQHHAFLGACGRCDAEVDSLLRRVDRGERLRTSDLNLNVVQRKDFELLLLSRQVRGKKPDAAT